MPNPYDWWKNSVNKRNSNPRAIAFDIMEEMFDRIEADISKDITLIGNYASLLRIKPHND